MFDCNWNIEKYPHGKSSRSFTRVVRFVTCQWLISSKKYCLVYDQIKLKRNKFSKSDNTIHNLSTNILYSVSASKKRIPAKAYCTISLKEVVSKRGMAEYSYWESINKSKQVSVCLVYSDSHQKSKTLFKSWSHTLLCSRDCVFMHLNFSYYQHC